MLEESGRCDYQHESIQLFSSLRAGTPRAPADAETGEVSVLISKEWREGSQPGAGKAGTPKFSPESLLSFLDFPSI